MWKQAEEIVIGSHRGMEQQSMKHGKKTMERRKGICEHGRQKMSTRSAEQYMKHGRRKSTRSVEKVYVST
jgi:hypothetical protein